MPNPVTNAYAEALNVIIKLINKTGRGYNFNVLIAKILFNEGTHKVITPKFNNWPASSDMDNMIMRISEAGTDYLIWDHGADMYTLIHLLVDGTFFSDQQ
jgi:hypothetical protein